MIGFGRKKSKQLIRESPLEEVIVVDISTMDERFDRSAGRFCEHCWIFGSHHTATHNDFARAALTPRELHH